MATFKILAIDGGGIRGIIPAYWLMRLENELKSHTNKSLWEIFDLFAGTSTGSIIAAGLATEKTAQEMLNLYTENGLKIFAKPLTRNPLRRWGGIVRPAYNGRGLDEVLLEKFGTKKLGEFGGKKPLLITAFNGGSRTLKMFDTLDPTDHEHLLHEVVRASCAAPTYLPAKIMKAENLKRPFLDGGVAANNPSALALAKALQLGHSPNNIVLVSLGTGVSTRPVTVRQGLKRGWAAWAKPIVDVMFDGSSDANHKLIKSLLPNASYFRFQKRDLKTDDALDRADGKHLDNLKNEAANYLDTEASERFKDLISILTQDEPKAAHSPLNGRWRSKYTWTRDLKKPLQNNGDWEEVVVLNVVDHHVIGETETSRYPYKLDAKIIGDVNLIGKTESFDPEKSVKLISQFVLRLDIEKGPQLNGFWCGTGNELQVGDWELTKI